MTQSIENKVIEYLKDKQKGKIYFSNDFASLGNSESIRKSLSNLVKKELLIRLTQGIYLYPKIDKEFGVLCRCDYKCRYFDFCRSFTKNSWRGNREI